MRIDIVTEILCPWCVIALHRLDKVLARDFPGLKVEFVHHPLLLTADFPDEGYDPREQLKTRYGITDVEAAWARPEAEARASGIPLDLSKQPRLHRTDRAHVLIRHAHARGTQHALALAITDAFFFHSQNINDPEVLAGIAAQHGFLVSEASALILDDKEIAAVHAESDAMRRKGVTSVPAIIFPDGTILQTSPESVFVDAIRHAMEPKSAQTQLAPSVANR